MALLYADENYPHTIVDALRALGHDVLTAQEDGRANLGIDDPDVLQRAIQLGRAVLTEDRFHFHRLHRQVPAHRGIITNTFDPDSDAVAVRIDSAVLAVFNLAGQLIRITRPSRTAKP